MNTKKLPDKVKEFYRGCSYQEATGMVVFFVVILLAAWFFTKGFPESRLLTLHPRRLASIPAILFSHFFHKDLRHLLTNLLAFVPLGLWVFKREGVRGVFGVLLGMLVAGCTIWLFGQKGTTVAGFSSAVFACVGILLVRSIRESVVETVILLVVLYFFLEESLFETIRPTLSTEAGNISWIGHLGGLMGGMMAQIRSLQIALEMLYKQGQVTEEEFNVIAARIDKSGELFYGEIKKEEERKTETPGNDSDNSNDRVTP